MATSAHKTRLFVGDIGASSTASKLASSNRRNILERSAFSDASHVFIPGVKSHGLSVGFMFDDDTTSTNAQWSELTGHHTNATDIPLTVYPGGETVDGTIAAAWLAEANQQTWDTDSDVDGTVDIAAEFATTGPVLFGQTLVASSTALTATGNGTAVDGGAASTNGGYGHVHVTAATGTSIDVTIQDSADGATGWATIATFTQITGTSSQRVTVAAGTTVKRYLRASYTVVGTTFTTTVAFARA